MCKELMIQRCTQKKYTAKILLKQVKSLYSACIITATIVICLLTVKVREKLCIGNLSDQWTTSESEKTGLHGNIYDFVVDHEAIVDVGPIYDLHRYLMIKHNIASS